MFSGKVCTVSDPRTLGEGREKYTTYRIETSSKFVRRRYSDFQWLYPRLQIERPCAIIPIMQHTRAVQHELRFSEDLINQRCIHMEQFLTVVCLHPELKDAPSLRIFLNVEAGEEFDTAKKEVEKSNPTLAAGRIDDSNSDLGINEPRESGGAPTTEKKGLFGGVRNLVAKTATAVAVKRGNTELEITTNEDEEIIEQITTYVDGIEKHVKELEKEASAIIKSVKDSSTNMKNIGQTIFDWALVHQTRYCPEATDLTVSTLGKISKFNDELSSVTDKKVSKEIKQFEECVKDLARTIQSTRVALKQRYDAQLTCTTAVKKIESTKNKLERLHDKINNDGNQMKISKTEMEIVQAEKDAEAAKKRFKDVTQRFLREEQRIHPIIDKSLVTCILNYSKIQIDFNTKTSDAWSKLVPHLDTFINDGLETVDVGNSNTNSSRPARPASPPPPSSFPDALVPPTDQPSFSPPPSPPAQLEEVNDSVANNDGGVGSSGADLMGGVAAEPSSEPPQEDMAKVSLIDEEEPKKEEDSGEKEEEEEDKKKEPEIAGV